MFSILLHFGCGYILDSFNRNIQVFINGTVDFPMLGEMYDYPSACFMISQCWVRCMITLVPVLWFPNAGWDVWLL